VVEAMVRGIPVIASNVGGLTEAKLGIDYVLPVNAIESYEQSLDGNDMPVPIVPDQPVTIWRDTLRRLLDDPRLYDAISRASRDAAVAYIERMTIEPFERYLLERFRTADEVAAT
jgi:glycosyltransferase involved in cell wall biosynthesis